MAEAKSKRKRGRPRKDGKPPGSVPVVKKPTIQSKPTPPPIPAARPSVESSSSAGSGPEAASQETLSAIPTEPASGARATSQPSAPLVIEYALVVNIANGIIRETLGGKYSMTEEEETNIGKALDALIEKRWPSLKEAGPEVALTLALGSYLARVYFVMRADRATRQAATRRATDQERKPDAARENPNVQPSGDSERPIG